MAANRKKGMPPTGLMRYCCNELKEHGGKGCFTITGVRWAESLKRKNQRGSVELLTSKVRDKLILNADNDESRRMLEQCQRKGKYVLNPIVDWSDDDVWEFLRHYGCGSNPLYQCGYKRIGCIGCPMAGKHRTAEFERYPKYKENYIRAFDRMIQTHPTTTWRTGQDVFDWWMNDKKTEKITQEQISMEL